MKPLNRLVWLFIFAPLAACGGGDPRDEAPEPARAGLVVSEAGPEQTASVTIKGMAFSPARLEVKAGASVTFRNADQVAHTVTARDGSFNSGNIMPGASWRRTFSKPGTYSYYCQPHPQMTGTVVVR
jgi:plastocyanin